MQYIGVLFKKNQGFSKSFLSNMGVKQGYPPSPTLFGIYIDELEELILEYLRIDGPSIGIYTIFILLYVDLTNHSGMR